MSKFFAFPKDEEPKRENSVPVHLVYWHPGRVFKNESDLPATFVQLRAKAVTDGSIYASYAGVLFDDGLLVEATTQCMASDAALLSRVEARNKAVGRLTGKLLQEGYDVAVDEGDGNLRHLHKRTWLA